MEDKYKINDEVEFTVMGVKCRGMINFISSNGLIRINSLVGEYRRKTEEVTLINRQNCCLKKKIEKNEEKTNVK